MAIAVWQAGIVGIVLTSAALASAITTTASQGKPAQAPVVASSPSPAEQPVLIKVKLSAESGRHLLVELTGRQLGDISSVTIESPLATYTFGPLSFEHQTSTAISFDPHTIPAGSYVVSARSSSGRATVKMALVIKSK